MGLTFPGAWQELSLFLAHASCTLKLMYTVLLSLWQEGAECVS